MSESFISTLGYIGYVAGALTIIFSRIKSENLKDLQQRVDILEAERKQSQEQHLENQKAIANLEGQLNTYKEIPLSKIAVSLESLDKSNAKILKVLDGSEIMSKQKVG